MKSGSAALLTVLGVSFCFGVSVGYAVTGGLVGSAAKEGVQRVERSAFEAYGARDGERQFAGEGRGIKKRSLDRGFLYDPNDEEMVKRTVKSAAKRRGTNIQTKPLPITERKTTKSSRMSDSAVREQPLTLSPWRNSPVAALDTISNLLPALEALTESVSRSIARNAATPHRRNALRLGLRGRSPPFRSDWPAPYTVDAIIPLISGTVPPFLPGMPPFLPNNPVGRAPPPFDDESIIITSDPDFVQMPGSTSDLSEMAIGIPSAKDDEYGELDSSDGDVEYISEAKEELDGGDGDGDDDDDDDDDDEEGGLGINLTSGIDVDNKLEIPPRLWEAVLKSISRAADDF